MALFAITLNCLQPLAHAALTRAEAASALWNGLCNASAAEPDGDKQNSKSPAADAHTCCLGLAHAVTVAPPPTAFVMVALARVAAVVLPAADQPTGVGIRGGPGQPRGPPFLA
ncbi:MAG: DUF2946 family protein [Rhodospirillales bacterium]|nr:DUF2946 family protein [Rhodospirillales bacterium]